MTDAADELRRSALARGFAPAPSDGPDTWARESGDGSERALVQVAEGAYEARVYRHPTGPTPGPDPELDNGPQVFATPDEALDYAESNLGAD